MLMPSIFGENLFDDFFNDFPFYYDDKAMKDGKLMENDIVLYRYADVLLMKSEAKIRNGGAGDEELNRVRSRVGASYREATLENLHAERQLEFAWEGWRRQDLI